MRTIAVLGDAVSLRPPHQVKCSWIHQYQLLNPRDIIGGHFCENIDQLIESDLEGFNALGSIRAAVIWVPQWAITSIINGRPWQDIAGIYELLIGKVCRKADIDSSSVYVVQAPQPIDEDARATAAFGTWIHNRQWSAATERCRAKRIPARHELSALGHMWWHNSFTITTPQGAICVAHAVNNALNGDGLIAQPIKDNLKHEPGSRLQPQFA